MDDSKLTELINDEKVIDVLESKDHLELAKLIGRELCGFTPDDEKYVDLFWDTAFNKSWLYVSEEIVNNQFGYENGKDMMRDFYRKLKLEFDIGIDYKEVNKDHILVKSYSELIPNRKTSNRKKYYIISGETYKSLLQSAQTKQGKITRRYFIKVESLGNITTQAIFKYMEIQKKQELKEKEQLISKLENRQLKLESFVKNIRTLEKNQIFYIATTQNYARQSRYEYGGVKDAKDLSTRLATYNTGRAEGDLYYYTKIFKCNSYKLIEERIGNILQQFKDKIGSRKEMLHLHYNLLVEIVGFICDNYDKEVDYINAKCQQFLNETVDNDGVIPDPLDLSDYMEITIQRRGKTKTQKIDVSGWDDEKINQTIEKIINLCATEQKKLQYNFSTQKNSVALDLTWGLLTPYLDLYNGLTKTTWRDKFKNWYKKEKPGQLRIKGIKFE